MDSMEKMVLVNGQWQGGGNTETLEGAQAIERELLADVPHQTVPINTSEDLKVAGGIYGLSVIRRQTKAALEILRTYRPARVFTVGGGCDADVASVAYLNQKYRGDLIVVWMDAHGDVNSPEESESHLFYCMPLRILLGARRFTDLVDEPLEPRQVINFGGRDFDAAEAAFLKEEGIPVVAPGAQDPVQELLAQVRRRRSKNVYIHLDLDVLDPDAFSSMPYPVEGGVSAAALKDALAQLTASYNVVGMGLFEYRRGAEDDRALLNDLVQVGLDS